MPLTPYFLPSLTHGGFIGTSQLRGNESVATPTRIIKVGKIKPKSSKVKIKRTEVKVKQKRKKSRLGAYGRYLF